MKADSPAELLEQFAEVLASPDVKPNTKGYNTEGLTGSSLRRQVRANELHARHRRAKDPAYVAAEQSKNSHGPSARATFVRAQQKRLAVEATGARFANRIVLNEKGKEVWV